MYFAYDTIRSVCVCVGMPPLYCTKIVCIVEYSIYYVHGFQRSSDTQAVSVRRAGLLSVATRAAASPHRPRQVMSILQAPRAKEATSGSEVDEKRVSKTRSRTLTRFYAAIMKHGDATSRTRKKRPSGERLLLLEALCVLVVYRYR